MTSPWRFLYFLGVVAWLLFHHVTNQPPASSPERQAIERGHGRIVIVPRFDGGLLPRNAEVQVRVTISDERTGERETRHGRLVNGEIDLPGLRTGIYDVQVGIDVNYFNTMGKGLGMPGDYQAFPTEEWALVKDGQTLRREVETQRLIRLLEPEDSAEGIVLQDGDPEASFHSPVTFTWDPVPSDVTYRVEVIDRDGKTVERADTAATTWSVDLPVGLYGFSVEARGRSGVVGRFEVAGAEQRGFSYPFRVVDAAEVAVAPSAVRPPATARLVVVPTLDGRRLRLPPRTAVRLWLSRQDRATMVDVAPTKGVLELLNVPADTYTVRLRLDLDSPQGGPPLHCTSARGQDVAATTLVAGTSTRHEVPLECTVRLEYPEDTFDRLAIPRQALPSSVTFRWYRVPRARRYTYKLTRGSIGSPETVAEGETDGTTWSTELEPSLPRQEYRFTVSAQGRRTRVGALSVSTALGSGVGISDWYDFRVAGGEPRPGKGRVELVPLLDGAPLGADLALPVSVNLFDNERQVSHSFDTRLANGAIVVDGVETGIYRVFFALKLKEQGGGRVRGLPIDILSSTESPLLPLLADGETIRSEIPVMMPVELLEPEVANRAYPSDLPTLNSSVHVRWKPVPGAQRYLVDTRLFDRSAALHPEQRDESSLPTWSGTLSPTESDASYFVVISAQGARDVIAKTFFRFRVAP